MYDGIRRTSIDRVATVTTTSGLFVQGNPDRIALIICPPQTNEITLSTTNPVLSGQGFNMRPGAQYTPLFIEWVGDWIQRDIFAIAATATETIGYLEVLAVGLARKQGVYGPGYDTPSKVIPSVNNPAVTPGAKAFFPTV